MVAPEAKGAFGLLTEILLLETGDRAAREAWTKAQLANVIAHAQARSRLWARRIGPARAGSVALADLPEMSRADLIAQVEAEGPLLGPAEGVETSVHSTSGSTGQPVTFHITQANGLYNEVRLFAQYLLENRDLKLTRLRTNAQAKVPPPGYRLKRMPSYAGALEPLFETGEVVELLYANVPGAELARIVRSTRPGLIVCAPRFLEEVVAAAGFELFRSAKVKAIICLAEAAPDWIREGFDAIGVPLRANYSAEEVGLIGVECPATPGCYHVATSNVVVEEAPGPVEYEGVARFRLLVTHLHGYATPFIRYEIGDLGKLAPRCACGHDGPVITHLAGRLSSTLRHADGSRGQFHVRGGEVQDIVPATREFRIRQTRLDLLEAELVAPGATPAQAEAFADHLRARAGAGFRAEVRFVDTIDWGPSPKRLSFRCEV
ncbi:hypothetical protein NK718_16375 [Alsobacter sp. SYSU M60028]|uniref:Phenylacetate--CoA ligase family protein n=1 Tax=Alsobacter ponti TaxID=2962936 RepID=A0ABT1LFA3_9HYPH|nr:hypothetical protein [Alsobacter ponti]MCP8940104.1 hypothetical protein [Alsobacter ponti]